MSKKLNNLYSLIEILDDLYHQGKIDLLRETIKTFLKDIKDMDHEKLLLLSSELRNVPDYHFSYSVINKHIWAQIFSQNLLTKLDEQQKKSFLHYVFSHPQDMVMMEAGKTMDFWKIILHDEYGRIWKTIVEAQTDDAVFEQQFKKAIQEKNKALLDLFEKIEQKPSQNESQQEEDEQQWKEALEKRNAFRTLNQQRKEAEKQPTWIYSSIDWMALILKEDPQEWAMMDNMRSKGGTLQDLSWEHTQILYQKMFSYLEYSFKDGLDFFKKLQHWGLQPLTNFKTKNWLEDNTIIPGEILQNLVHGNLANTKEHRWRWVALEILNHHHQPLLEHSWTQWNGEDNQSPLMWAKNHHIGPFTSFDILRSIKAIYHFKRESNVLLNFQTDFIEQHQIQKKVINSIEIVSFFKDFSNQINLDLIRTMPMMGISTTSYDAESKAHLIETILLKKNNIFEDKKYSFLCAKTLFELFEQEDKTHFTEMLNYSFHDLPLTFLALKCTPDLLQWMTEKGANLQQQTKSGENLFHFFCQNIMINIKKVEEIEPWICFFKKNAIDIHKTNNQGQTGFHLISKNAPLSYLENLISLASFEILDIQDNTQTTFWDLLKNRKDYQQAQMIIEKKIMNSSLNDSQKSTYLKQRL